MNNIASIRSYHVKMQWVSSVRLVILAMIFIDKGERWVFLGVSLTKLWKIRIIRAFDNLFIRGSSNGRTAAFEAVNLGSSPSPRAIHTSTPCFRYKTATNF